MSLLLFYSSPFSIFKKRCVGFPDNKFWKPAWHILSKVSGTFISGGYENCHMNKVIQGKVWVSLLNTNQHFIANNACQNGNMPLILKP